MPYTQLIKERLEFLDIDADVVAEIRRVREILEPAMDAMLDRFYTHILKEPALRELFADQDAIDRARSAQKNHWLRTLFAGNYDDAYFQKTSRIGNAHARVGLTPSWYIGGYCQMLGQIIELISKHYADRGESATRTIQAAAKAVLLDMDLVIHCYLDAKDGSMREILRRATDFTGDVKALSGGLSDCAARITATTAALSADADGPATRVDELMAQAEELTRQTARLAERLEELQFRDKLYIEERAEDTGTISRLRALISGKS